MLRVLYREVILPGLLSGIRFLLLGHCNDAPATASTSKSPSSVPAAIAYSVVEWGYSA
jgi:hypothetical protein